MSKEAINPAPGFSGLPLSSSQIEAYSFAIRSLISPQIMSQAEQIIASHRPEGVLPGEEPLCMAGLKPKDHGFLNGLVNVPLEEKRRIYAQKRTEYVDDPIALQQIDAYDGDSKYYDKLSEFADAIKSGDTTRESALSAWFKKHYPDIK